MPRGQHESAFHLRGQTVRSLPGQLRHGLPCVRTLPGHQVQGGHGTLRAHRGVRLAHEVRHRLAEPVVPPGGAVGLPHALLHHGPGTSTGDEKGVVVQLVSVLYCVVVHLRAGTAGVHEAFRVEAKPLPVRPQLLRGPPGSLPLPAGHRQPEVPLQPPQPLLESFTDGGGEAAAVPVEAQHAPKRLEPEGVAQPAEEGPTALRPPPRRTSPLEPAGPCGRTATAARRRCGAGGWRSPCPCAAPRTTGPAAPAPTRTLPAARRESGRTGPAARWPRP